ncbi:glycosyltransferase [Latilactobacillus curvatus]|uniref:glycosyltransferase n=1 Tax=Latilactobacillus TaxID=2767885 RepID=UPI0011DDF29A|nr:glycosyltransferase [Latilactobacillus curvatus]
MKKRKVSILMPYTTGMGGTETVVKNLFDQYNSANEINYELKLFLIGGTSNTEWVKNCDYSSYSMSKLKILRTIEYIFTLPIIIFKYLKDNKVDIVVSTNPIIWAIAYMLNKMFFKNVKTVAWYHYSLRQKDIRKIFLKSADYYWAISSGIQEELIERGIDESRIFLVFNPIPNDGELIQQGISNRAINLVYIGRLMLDGQKNFRELLKALTLVKAKWNLSVYGGGDLQDCKGYADELGVNDNIHWMGFVNNPWKEINKVDALLLTSKYEGLPMVLGEAMAHGVFCISSKCPTGPDDFIVNNQVGFLYTPGDYHELAKKIESVKEKQINNELIQTSMIKFSAKNYYKRIINSLDYLVR